MHRYYPTVMLADAAVPAGSHAAAVAVKPDQPDSNAIESCSVNVQCH